MGPSGSGKSTLLHCLAGILPPDAGSVTFDGRELTAMSDLERSALRRRDFGFVFQFGQLVPELTAARTRRCRCGSRACGGGRPSGARPRGSSGSRSPTSRGKRPGEISGGEGQRVAVARALVDRAARRCSPTSRPARSTRSTASA